MPYCCSRSFLALLLGAGVSGWFSLSALAGDKIEFSSLDSETLAAPAVDRAESEPLGILSEISLVNYDLPRRQIYRYTPPVAEPPARRDDPLNPRNRNDVLGSELDRSRQDNSYDNAPWETYATNYTSKRASNYLDGLGAWGNSGTPNAFVRGSDKLNSRYGQGDARLESATFSQRRERPGGLDASNAGSKTRASGSDDENSSGAKLSYSDWLRTQNRSYLEPGYGLLKPLTLLPVPKDVSAWSPSSTLPSDPALGSPLDALETGRDAYNAPSTRAASPTRSYSSSKNSGKADEGNSTAWPSMRAWGDDTGPGFESPDPAAARKPSTPAPTAGAQKQQQGGATLTRPKMPGSVFN